MASVMAIVSKAVFEKEAKGLAVGDVWSTARYASANKGLAALAGGGDLYLVTVRPPDEALWLVAVLTAPTFVKTEWRANANTIAIRDISALKQTLEFANSAGLPAKAGTLGMSLQTPRVLADGDLAQLAAKPALARPAPAKSASVAKPAPGGSDDLAAALDHLRNARAGAALTSVLAAWRKLRAPELAKLLDKIGKQIDRSLPALAGAKDQLQTQWLDLAARRRAIDVGRLVAALPQASISQLRARYEVLAGFVPDPRVVAAALTIPQRYHSYEAGPLLSAAFTMAEQSADPRARKILDDMLGDFLVAKKGDSKAWREHLDKHARRAAKVRDALPAKLAVPPAIAAQIDACNEAVDALVGKPDVPSEDALAAEVAGGPRDNRLEALLAAVLDDPSDAAARAVYGDALSEAGDPRGELIALQLERERTGKASGAADKRERELIKAHAHDWLHPIDAALRPDSIRFAGGFLDACRVEFRTDGQRDALLGHGQWATVRELDCDDMQLVTHACMKSLRRATATPQALATLAARAEPVLLEAVIGPLEMRYGVRMRTGICPHRPAAWGRALDVGALAKLTSLQLTTFIPPQRDGDEWIELEGPKAFAWLLDSTLGRQLTELDLLGTRSQQRILPWIEDLARRDRPLRVRYRFTNGNTASGASEYVVTYELERRGATVAVTMSVNQDMASPDFIYYSIGGQIKASLAGLPSKLAPAISVRYVGSKKRSEPGYPKIADALRKAFATVEMDA
jgi:uncharacterized protein (TIGR02996 family)